MENHDVKGKLGVQAGGRSGRRAGAALLVALLTSISIIPQARAQADGEGLADIVVTAERRSENLQRTALAVSVVSGENLVDRGVTNPDALSKIVPALVVQPTGGSGSNFYVRGVGGQGANPVNENAVAFAVDGVFIGRPSGVVGNFYDLERVEVLKGPQGTLYGRNATGGAINLVTRKPVIGTTAANMTFEYGNYNQIKALAAVNLPLTSDLALRVSGQLVRHDGYLSQGYDDENGKAVRAQLLYRPGSTFSLLLAGDYYRQDGKGPGSVLVGSAQVTDAPRKSARISGTDPRSYGVIQAAFPTQFNSGVIQPPPADGYNHGDSWGVSATADVDLGFATLTVIPAYRKSMPDFVGGRPGFYGSQSERNSQFSLETRLSSPDDQALRYVLGAFYFDQTQKSATLFRQGTTNATDTMWDNSTKSYAGFGQVTWEMAEGFRLVGGLRYTKEDKAQDVLQRNPTAANPDPAYVRFLDDVSFERVTWKAGVEFDAGPRNLLYANVATGFKSGGLSPTAGDPFYDPESLTAYTIGTKNRFLSNRLQLNLELYYWDYKDQQVAALSPVQSGTGAFVTAQQILNVGNARMYGFDFDANYKLFERGLLNLQVAYLNSKYKSFTYGVATAGGAAPVTACGYAVDGSVTLPAPARGYVIDCSGMPAVNAPKWSVNAGYEHSFPLGDDLNLVASVQTAYQTGRYLSVDFLTRQYQKAVTTTDAALTLEGPDQQWSLTAWVNNIENSIIMNQAFNRPIANVIYAGLRPPRTYGMHASFKF